MPESGLLLRLRRRLFYTLLPHALGEQRYGVLLNPVAHPLRKLHATVVNRP